MVNKIIFFLLFSISLKAQITKKELESVPPVADLVQPEPIFLSIGKKIFTQKDFTQLYRRNLQTDTLPDKTPKQFLDIFINNQLKISKAESDGLDTTMAFREEMATLKKELVSSFMVEKPVYDALIKEAYERLETEVNVAHILIGIDEFAAPDDTLIAYNKLFEIRTRILNGEKFNDLALAFSTDATVKKDEGNLGYITAFQTLYPFESACYKTPIGKVSMPFRTKHGYHIVKVIGKREYQRWKTAHIFVANNMNASEIDQATAKRKIDEIYTKLQAGQNFEKLARQYSEDQTTNLKGGVFKRLFGTDELEKPFEEALFSLKKYGSYSTPIKTSKGFHIVRLIEKQELLEFNDMYNFLQNKVAADSRATLATNALLVRIKKENLFKGFQSVIFESKQLIDSLLINNVAIVNVKTELPQKTIFSIGDKEIAAKKYIDYALQNGQELKNNYNKSLPDKWFNEFEMAENLIYEEENLEKKNPLFGQLMNEYREGILLQKIDDYKTRILDDTLAQRKYYIKNVVNYQLPERLSAEIIDASNIENLRKIKEIFTKEPYFISLKWSDILFQKNMADLTLLHKNKLNDLALMLLKNSNYQLEVAGNSDPEENEAIASERIQNVVKIIADLGVPLERIIEKNNGKFQPLSKTDREKNRRIEFKLFSTKKEDVVKLQNALKPESIRYINGTFKRGDNKTVDLLKWQIGEQQIEKSNRYIYANINKVEPARAMLFQEAKGKVLKEMMENQETNLLLNLKSTYPIILNEELLKKITK